MGHLTQGVVRNRKATFHVPLNVEMNTDIGKLQMDFTYATPKRILQLLLHHYYPNLLLIMNSIYSILK